MVEIRFLLCLIFYVIKMMLVACEDWPPEGFGVGRATKKRKLKTNILRLHRPMRLVGLGSDGERVHH